MTQRRVEIVGQVVYVVILVAYAGALLYIAVPGMRQRIDRGRQWARYARWRARFEALPGYLQEALIVRGRGPA